MVERYNPAEIEKKWQQQWETDKLYRQERDERRPKWYALTMYPYPSGDLHIGHWYAMAPADVKARYMRMKGFNVLFPMGFDAFGLPAENAAIKHGIHPYKWTLANIERMRKQLKTMGPMFDWKREAITCDPKYYKWTQWFFMKFFEHGLAYRTKAPVDWCPTCNTTLAREQVWGEDRHCERCNTPVVRKDLNQWLFRITNYAEELLDFSQIEWPERVVTMQRNWIGRSEGVEFAMQVAGSDASFRVFTTRPDTIFGMTFAVLAPEHALVEQITTPDQRASVDAYVAQARRQSEIERTSTEKERTGVFTGAYAINPMNGESVPIYIADYVLTGYGTGAIMAVPAHDDRDGDFARKYGLPLPVVIAPADWAGEALEAGYTGYGVMVNSGPFTGMTSEAGFQKIADEMQRRGIGERKVNYRLHDWLISRQRYWGAPIPIVYCPTCGTVPVPEKDLPVLLPEDAEFMPTGESPLKYHEKFLHTTCPKCGGPAERETDTMDTFMCSSWYQYRYLSPDYADAPFDPAEGAYWLPVDQYTGGIEHATMHLLYTRFFTKAMRDIGLVKFSEPMLRLFNQGIILGEDSEKMSKSRGNVVNPDALVGQFGADTMRVYLMFIGPWEEGGPWNSKGIEGAHRFLQRVWTVTAGDGKPELQAAEPSAEQVAELRRMTHKTVRRVTRDMDGFQFNTMLAALMEYNNYLMQAKETAVYGSPAWDEAVCDLVLMLAPAAPHVAEEMWSRLGQRYSVHQQAWPTWDDALAAEQMATLIVQVNGKVRDKISVPADVTGEAAQAQALASAGAQRALAGKTPDKVFYVPGRLVNIVVR